MAPAGGEPEALPARRSVEVGTVPEAVEPTPQVTLGGEDDLADPLEFLERFEAPQLTEEHARAEAARQSKNWKAAAEALNAFYTRPARFDAPLPYPGDTLAVVLELFRERSPDTALEILRVFEAFTNENAAWASRMAPHDTVRWTLLRELRALHSSGVGKRLLGGLADAILKDDFEGAAGDLADWRNAGGKIKAFKRDAPTLHSMLRAHLPFGTPQSRRDFNIFGWLASSAIMYALIRGCRALFETREER
jgi:hypothetical protein